LFKNKAKIKKVLIIAISLALFLIPMFFVSAQTPAPSQGDWGKDTVIGIVNFIVGGVCIIATAVISLFLGLVGTVFDWIVGGTYLKVDQINEIVTAGWVIVRDILNILFVLALLGIAFATILRIESYHFKALLPKLLVAALLVNFSKTIALTLVDFSNAIMYGIMGTQNGATASAAFLALFEVSGFFDLSLKLGSNISIFSADVAVLASNITIVAFLGMFTMALAGLSVLLVIRTVVLMILIVFSPVAFVLNVLPVTQKYASKWWEEFTKYLFVGPVVCICYLLALLFAVKFSQGGGLSGIANNVPGQLESNLGVTAGKAGNFFGLAVACGIMFVGFTFAKEAAGGLAGAAMNLVKKGLLGAGALAGGFAWRKANESLASGSKGALGKLTSLIGQKVFRRSQAVADKFADNTKLLSPTVLAGMWKERQAIRTSRAMSGAAGFVHSRFNKLTNLLPGVFGKDTTDYERRGQLEAVDHHIAEGKKYGKGNHSYYRKELREALESKDMDKAEAMEILLSNDGNINEAHREEELGSNVNNIEYDKHGDPLIDKATGKVVKVPDKPDYEVNPDGSMKLDAAGMPIEKKDATGKTVMIGGNVRSFSKSAYIDRLIKTYGKKRALEIMAGANEGHRRNGNWNLAELVQVNEKGDLEIDMNQSANAAGEWKKKSGREGLGGQRFQLFEESMGPDGSVVDVEIAGSLKEKIKNSGIGDDWIKNIGFMIDTNKAMVNQFRGRLYHFIQDPKNKISKANRDSAIRMIQKACEATGGKGAATHYSKVKKTAAEIRDDALFDAHRTIPDPGKTTP